MRKPHNVIRDIAALCVTPTDPVRLAIACIDAGRCGIALVTDADGRLRGTITDGDIRRAILAHQDMETPIQTFLDTRVTLLSKPVTAVVGTDPAKLLALMSSQSIRQIPLLDNESRVAGLATLDDLVPQAVLPMQAVIIAGGLGTRLLPLTEDLPKPMLPVGGRPLMELIVKQLQQTGIRRINVTTHYKPEKIIEHFGDGRAFGIELNYVKENMPLGTAGGLGLMPAPQEPLLVINGDILTQVDFRAMLAYHREHRAEMTVAVSRYEFQVPFGVIESEYANVRSVNEKPQIGFFINAGIYLLEPSTHQYIPNGQAFHMTDLIQCLLDAGRPVVSFPIREYWSDIGHHADYIRAQEDVEEGRLSL